MSGVMACQFYTKLGVNRGKAAYEWVLDGGVRLL